MEKAAFDGHQLWGSLEQLKGLLEQAEDRDMTGSGASLPEMRYVVALAQSHRDTADTTPYSAAGLNNVQNQITAAVNEVSNFVANGNPGHMTNAYQQIDQAQLQLGSWPTPTLKGGAAAQANKIFAAYRKEADAALTSLRQTNEDLRRQLAEAAADHSAEVTAIQSEVTALSNKISDDEGRINSALTANNDAFTSKQTEREEKFEAFLKEQAGQLKRVASADLDAINTAMEGAKARYREIDELRDGTEKVAGLASADILAGKYSAYSKQQWGWGIGANIGGFVTLAVGLGLVAWALSGVKPDEKISWGYTLLKLGVTLTVVTASAVAFRLGNAFLRESRDSKQTELELRAIGPFFADIDDPNAVKEAKKLFVERSFGRRANDGRGRNESEDALKTLQPVIDLVKAAANNHPIT